MGDCWLRGVFISSVRRLIRDELTAVCSQTTAVMGWSVD